MTKTHHEKSLSFAEIKPVKEYAPSFNYRHFLEMASSGKVRQKGIRERNLSVTEEDWIVGKTRGCTIWLTGLSGAGKSTIAMKMEEYLVENNIPAYVLDGDNVRHGLNQDLTFSPDDREENIRRIGELSCMFADSGMVCLVSFISPYRKDRDLARSVHEKAGIPFYEAFIGTPLEECERRDVKGLYKKARTGVIKNFTGIGSPYEPPIQPDVLLRTHHDSLERCVGQLVAMLEENKVIKAVMNHPIKDLFVLKSEYTTKCMLAKSLRKLEMSQLNLQWFQVLSEGWATPLNGFMREDELLQTLHFNVIKQDSHSHNQAIPIVLSLNEKQYEQLKNEYQITLSREGCNYGILKNIEFYRNRREERCAREFGIYSKEHPYTKTIWKQGNWLVGGDLEALERVRWRDGLDQYRKTPAELRKQFTEMGADAVFAFQLRNPVHNGHALLMNETAKELKTRGYKKPVLLLHPLGGCTKKDDVSLKWRIKQHKAVLDEKVLDPDATVIAIWPSPMSYGGPTEVQWHAKSRLVTGATFYIVGRDPAGMKYPGKDTDIYDPTHGSRVLRMAPGMDNYEILPFKVAAYNKILGKMDFFDPMHPEKFTKISGSKMRKAAREGLEMPTGLMAPKAWKVLTDYYKAINSA